MSALPSAPQIPEPAPSHRPDRHCRPDRLAALRILLLSFVLTSPLAGRETIHPVLQTTFTNLADGLDDRFGSSLAVLGSDLILVGAPFADVGGPDAGVAHLLHSSGTPLTTLTNPAPAAGDHFGFSVAAIGNDRVLVGTPEADLGAANAGVAYLMSTNGTLVTTLSNPAPTPDAQFGYAVASVGKDCLLVGARNAEVGGDRVGKAYLFDTHGSLLTVFTHPEPAAGAQFGAAVAAFGSDRILIGAPFSGTAGPPAGAAFLFSTNGTFLARFEFPLKGDFPGVDQRFGAAVTAVGSDLVLIGAPNADVDMSAFTLRYGSAHLFDTNGIPLVNFINPNRQEGSFGQALAALRPDLILIGGPRNSVSAGTVHLFGTNGTLCATISIPYGIGGIGQLGSSLGVSSGHQVYVGAPRSKGGSAYLFDLAPSLEFNWNATGELELLWSSTWPDFVLQESTDATGWVEVTDPIQKADTGNVLHVSPAANVRFFRLNRP